MPQKSIREEGPEGQRVGQSRLLSGFNILIKIQKAYAETESRTVREVADS